MFKEEKYLSCHYGRDNNFKVPDCYFESFSKKMSEKMAEDYGVQMASGQISPSLSFRSHHRSVQLRRWIGGVAAGLFVATFSIGAYLHTANSHEGNHQKPQVQAVASQPSHSDYNIDAVVDYSMMDTDDMYAYMSEAI